MKLENKAKIYQPNLMCRYHLTSGMNNRMKVLTVVNHDAGVGICDEQVVESLWAWVKDYTRRLQSNNKANLPRQLPAIQGFLCMSEDASVYTVNVFCDDEDQEAFIEDIVLAHWMGAFCVNLARNLNVQLDGVPNESAPSPR